MILNVPSSILCTADESKTLYSFAGSRTYSRTPRFGIAFATMDGSMSTVNARETSSVLPPGTDGRSAYVISVASYAKSSSSTSSLSPGYAASGLAFARTATRCRRTARGRVRVASAAWEVPRASDVVVVAILAV